MNNLKSYNLEHRNLNTLMLSTANCHFETNGKVDVSDDVRQPVVAVQQESRKKNGMLTINDDRPKSPPVVVKNGVFKKLPYVIFEQCYSLEISRTGAKIR